MQQNHSKDLSDGAVFKQKESTHWRKIPITAQCTCTAGAHCTRQWKISHVLHASFYYSNVINMAAGEKRVIYREKKKEKAMTQISAATRF